MTCDRLLVSACCAVVCLLAWLGPTYVWAQRPECIVPKGAILPGGCEEQKCKDKDGKSIPCAEKILPGACDRPPGCDPGDPTTVGKCTGMTPDDGQLGEAAKLLHLKRTNDPDVVLDMENAAQQLTRTALKAIAVLAGRSDYEPQLAGRVWKPTDEELETAMAAKDRREAL